MRRTLFLLAIILAASAIQIETYFDADPKQCIEEKCPTQWAACQKDPKCIPALDDCEKKCGTKASCWTLCLPGKGSQAAIDVAKCAQAQGCAGIVPSTAVAIATPQECIEQHCRDQIITCSKDPKCFPALQDCEKECGENTACYSTCLAKKGNVNASNFWKCIIDNDCLNAVELSKEIQVYDPQQCVEEKCPNQWAACQKDSKCIPAINDCQKKCGTKSSCWTFCLPTKGSQAAIDVAKCAQANGCLGMIPTQAIAIFTGPEECVMKYCQKQEQACVNDRRCIQVMDECDTQCNTNFTCWNNCLSRRGNKNASDYFKCIIDNECYKATEESTAVALADPQQCVEQKCPNQWAACQKDPKCIPAIQDCQKKCGTKSSCWTFCLPTKGSQAAIDVAKCAQANGCLGAEPELSTALVVVTPQECIEQKCPTQWAACQKDPKCVPALQDCEKKCGTKASCWTLCLPGKGSQAAIDVAKCAQAQGCAGIVPSTEIAIAGPQECIEQHCRDQLHACQRDPKCFAALQDCEKECGNNTSCYSTCLAKKGNVNASNFWKCIIDNNCLEAVEESTAVALADPQQCIEEKCPTQWAACQKDPKCIPALEDCQNKCGTKISCWTLCLPGKGSQAAIDVGKCAQANDCLKAVEAVPAFESCMSKSCAKQHEECLSNWACRQSLRKCRTAKTIYDFDHECLFAEAKESSFVSEWYHCAGGHFCL